MGYKKCYVAFIDILGFKRYVSENSCDTVFGTLLTLKIEALTDPDRLKSKYGIDKNDVKVLCVSDSIIVSIEANIPYAFEAITEICAVFQAVLLLNRGMLMRGGISCGDFCMDDSGNIGNGILFGPAYNRAVELEKVAKYPIIKIDENIISDDVLANHRLLVKSSHNDTVFVDYMSLAKSLHFFDRKIKIAAKKIIEQAKICDSVKEKHDWTKNYIISSLGDDSIFSEESIASLDVNNRLRIKLCAMFANEEDTTDGQT